ncbi:hypothetical protein DXG01_007727 [Tephrocybe rancida]|nr:hypothetical protein DXG01_007727 [Tephrocybe rancida]
MSLYDVNWPKLWKDGRYFAQPPQPKTQTQKPSDGTLVGEILAVATDLLGGAYELGAVTLPFEPEEHLEILPTLSEQSAFWWARAARALASQLATAKYPIRAQASHLVVGPLHVFLLLSGLTLLSLQFWWARLGGLMGVTSMQARTGDQHDTSSFDGSNLEFSWVIPHDTHPSEACNRKIRFAIDPFHPERGHRVAGGAVVDYLWSEKGGMGLVKKGEGSKDWKDIIEKWLFPDIEDSGEFVEGTTYSIAFDLDPSGEIELKQYYMPPNPPLPGTKPKSCVAAYRGTDDLERFKGLARDLHPSLESPLQLIIDFVQRNGKESKMKWVMVACDVTRSEKNRLKLYILSERTKLKDMIYDMTLGGQIAGPRVDEAMANFSKFFIRLFPHAGTEEPQFQLRRNVHGEDESGPLRRNDVRMMYYYELFVGQSVPFSKIYFFMDHFSKNEYDTAQATELFFKDVGKPGDEGWITKALAHAYPHIALNKKNSIHTVASFGTKPTGWDITNYYSPEFFAPEFDE